MSEFGCIPLKFHFSKTSSRLDWAHGLQFANPADMSKLAGMAYGAISDWLPFSFISWHSCFTLHSPSVPHFLTIPPMCCVFQVSVTSQLRFSPCRILAPIYMSMKYWSFKTPWLKPSLSTLLVTAPDGNLTLLLWSLLLFIITLNTLSCYFLVDMSVPSYRRGQWLVQMCLRNAVKLNWDQGSFQHSDSRFVTDNLSFCLGPMYL